MQSPEGWRYKFHIYELWLILFLYLLEVRYIHLKLLFSKIIKKQLQRPKLLNNFQYCNIYMVGWYFD